MLGNQFQYLKIQFSHMWVTQGFVGEQTPSALHTSVLSARSSLQEPPSSPCSDSDATGASQATLLPLLHELILPLRGR